jgi:hypothetical protein
MELLNKCMHVSDKYEFGRKEVDKQSFKYVMYDLGGGHKRKKIHLVMS